MSILKENTLVVINLWLQTNINYIRIKITNRQHEKFSKATNTMNAVAPVSKILAYVLETININGKWHSDKRKLWKCWKQVWNKYETENKTVSADENNLENENAAKAEDKNENDVEFVSNENTTE